MNSVRCLIQSASISESYYPYASQDLIFKQTFLVHRTTESIPHTEWYGTIAKLADVPIFGHLGYIPTPNSTGKMTTDVNRYMGLINLTHVIFQLPDGHNLLILIVDFHSILPVKNPTRTFPASFPSFASRLHDIPAQIFPVTHAPLTLPHTKKYPDSHS